MMQTFQARLNSDERMMAILVGLSLGALTVIFGVLTAIGGPLIGFGGLIGLAVALYVLTDLMGGLYITLAVVALLPFATLPIKIALTPSFIDMALGGFLLVYLFQWMTGQRSRPRFLLVHLLIVAFMGFVLFSFVAGLGYGVPTTNILHKFVELLLSMAVAIILSDVIRDVPTLRRVTQLLLLLGALQAVMGIGLITINAQTAERLLNALSRFGYPAGGVIRYIEENPALAERAIGTWVDPNAYGGFLVLIGVLGMTQLLAREPVIRPRWAIGLLAAPVLLALLLTQSRGVLVGLGAAVLLISVIRYRWLLVVELITAAAFYVLPFTQSYVARLLQGVNNQDLATQMRFGEYKDALILIQRYPLIGTGFVGTPQRDIYLSVSSLYLTIAENSGLLGLSLFILVMVAIFGYSLRQWRAMRRDPLLEGMWLGYTLALVGALISGIFDHFYFNVEFNGASLIFWTVGGLALTAARLATETNTIPLLSFDNNPLNNPAKEAS